MDGRHAVLHCVMERAFVRKAYWSGSIFMTQDPQRHPPYLSFLGSRQFAYVLPATVPVQRAQGMASRTLCYTRSPPQRRNTCHRHISLTLVLFVGVVSELQALCTQPKAAPLDGQSSALASKSQSQSSPHPHPVAGLQEDTPSPSTSPSGLGSFAGLSEEDI